MKRAGGRSREEPEQQIATGAGLSITAAGLQVASKERETKKSAGVSCCQTRPNMRLFWVESENMSLNKPQTPPKKKRKKSDLVHSWANIWSNI